MYIINFCYVILMLRYKIKKKIEKTVLEKWHIKYIKCFKKANIWFNIYLLHILHAVKISFTAMKFDLLLFFKRSVKDFKKYWKPYMRLKICTKCIKIMISVSINRVWHVYVFINDINSQCKKLLLIQFMNATTCHNFDWINCWHYGYTW